MDGDAGGVINCDALRSYVDRVAHLHDQRDELNADIREVYREAKEAGFDTGVLREIVREYRTDAEPRQSRYTLLDAYRDSLGLRGTPLGDYAERNTSSRANAMRDALAEDTKPTPRRRGRPRKERPTDFFPDDGRDDFGGHAGTA
jgi:uncharacterized protein (UPF0335 family)